MHQVHKNAQLVYYAILDRQPMKLLKGWCYVVSYTYPSKKPGGVDEINVYCDKLVIKKNKNQKRWKQGHFT